MPDNCEICEKPFAFTGDRWICQRCYETKQIPRMAELGLEENHGVLSVDRTASLMRRAVEIGASPYVTPGRETPECGYSRILLYNAKGEFAGQMWVGITWPDKFRMNFEVDATPEEIAMYTPALSGSSANIYGTTMERIGNA